MEEFHSANLYWKYYQFHIPNSKKQCFSMKTFDCVGIHTFCLLGRKRENISSEKKKQLYITRKPSKWEFQLFTKRLKS